VFGASSFPFTAIQQKIIIHQLPYEGSTALIVILVVIVGDGR
jgi:hypothetical protein